MSTDERLASIAESRRSLIEKMQAYVDSLDRLIAAIDGSYQNCKRAMETLERVAREASGKVDR